VSIMSINLEDSENMTESKRILVWSIGLQNAQNKLVEHEGRLDAYDKLLLTGDGQTLPAMERIRNIEKYIENLRFWGRFIGTAIVLQTITFGTAAVVYFVKLYPLLDKLSRLP
jgi:hypothetical protein